MSLPFLLWTDRPRTVRGRRRPASDATTRPLREMLAERAPHYRPHRPNPKSRRSPRWTGLLRASEHVQAGVGRRDHGQRDDRDDREDDRQLAGGGLTRGQVDGLVLAGALLVGLGAR